MINNYQIQLQYDSLALSEHHFQNTNEQEMWRYGLDLAYQSDLGFILQRDVVHRHVGLMMVQETTAMKHKSGCTY